MLILLVLFFAIPLQIVAANAQVMCPAAATIPASVADCGNPEFVSCSVEVAGIDRHVCIHEPTSNQPTPAAGMPAIIGFHGGGGQASRAVEWMDHFTEDGTILVAPTSLRDPAQPGLCPAQWRFFRLDYSLTWADLALPDPNGCAPLVPIRGTIWSSCRPYSMSSRQGSRSQAPTPSDSRTAPDWSCSSI